MSSLGQGDQDLHHSDGSHRWTGGPAGMPLEAWQAVVRAHMQEHLATMGGPPALASGEVCALPTRAYRRAEAYRARQAKRAS